MKWKRNTQAARHRPRQSNLGYFATIGGGYLNAIQNLAQQSTIAGGANNTIQAGDNDCTIGGGQLNVIQTNSAQSTIAGGNNNTVQYQAAFSAIGGGYYNTIVAGAYDSVISGGAINNNGAIYGTLGGGHLNSLYGTGATLAGGLNNYNDAYMAGTLSGGQSNLLSFFASYSTIGSGGQPAADYIAGGDGVRRGGEGLARGQGEEVPAAVRAHPDLEPASRPREHIAEIQGDGEQAVAQGGGTVGQDGSLLAAPGAIVIDDEAQVVGAVGRGAGVSEAALVGEGGALRLGRVSRGEKTAKSGDDKKMPLLHNLPIVLLASPHTCDLPGSERDSREWRRQPA